MKLVRTQSHRAYTEWMCCSFVIIKSRYENRLDGRMHRTGFALGLAKQGLRLMW
jgi:hypothetical protein